MIEVGKKEIKFKTRMCARTPGFCGKSGHRTQVSCKISAHH